MAIHYNTHSVNLFQMADKEDSSTLEAEFPTDHHPETSLCWPPPSNDFIFGDRRHVSILVDVDLYGDDIGRGITNPVDSPIECAASCQDHRSCTHWSWVQNDARGYEAVFYRNCFLKSIQVSLGVSGTRVIPQPGVYSGVTRQKQPLLDHISARLTKDPFNRAMYFDIDLPGDDINNGIVNKKISAAACAEDCRSHLSCSHWSWVESDAPGYKSEFFLSCWHKLALRGIGAIRVQRVAGVFSGVARRKSEIYEHIDSRLQVS